MGSTSRAREAVAPSRVSVIVPCYNYAHYLTDCVQSVLSQTGVDVEILIIDDASTDETGALAASLSTRDPRVQVKRHSHNAGHIATYNEGFAWATGEYTVLLSADDMLTPGALRRATDLMNAHASVGFTYGRPLFMRGPQAPAPRTRTRGVKIWAGRDWLAKRCRATTNSISSPEVVLRTSLVRQLGGFRPELPHTGDLEFWMRCAVHADVGYVRSAHQAIYRIHPGSMLRTHYASALVDLRARREAFDLLFRSEEQFIEAPDELRAAVSRGLAREALRRACRVYDRSGFERSAVDDFVAFAFETSSDASALREHASLRWRARLGERRCALLRPFMVARLTRRARTQWSWWQINHRGV